MKPVEVWAAAAAVSVALAAGCAAPVTQEPVAGLEVRKIERPGWDAPPEPNLYRVDYGPALTAQVRRAASSRQGDGLMDRVRSEWEEMTRLAEPEFRRRQLCAHSIRLVSVVEGEESGPTLAALFRCAPAPLFF